MEEEDPAITREKLMRQRTRQRRKHKYSDERKVRRHEEREISGGRRNLTSK